MSGDEKEHKQVEQSRRDKTASEQDCCMPQSK